MMTSKSGCLTGSSSLLDRQKVIPWMGMLRFGDWVSLHLSSDGIAGICFRG